MPTLVGQDSLQAKRDYIYWEYPEKGEQVAIRMGKWKGVKTDIRKLSYAKSPWMIFDLEEDRKEAKDLATQHPDLAKRFDEIVENEHQPSHLKEWEIINPKFKPVSEK